MKPTYKDYLLWLVCAAALILASLAGWLFVNWILPLFADEQGNVSNRFLRLWQTHDDTLDGMKEPRFDAPMTQAGYPPGHYWRRVCWSHRNCAYGFAKLLRAPVGSDSFIDITGASRTVALTRWFGGLRYETIRAEMQHGKRWYFERQGTLFWPGNKYYLFYSLGWKLNVQYTTTKGDLTTELHPLRTVRV